MVLFSSLQNAVLPFKKNRNNNKNLYKYHMYNNSGKKKKKKKDLQKRSSLRVEW